MTNHIEGTNTAAKGKPSWRKSEIAPAHQSAYLTANTKFNDQVSKIIRLRDKSCYRA